MVTFNEFNIEQIPDRAGVEGYMGKGTGTKEEGIVDQGGGPEHKYSFHSCSLTRTCSKGAS